MFISDEREIQSVVNTIERLVEMDGAPLEEKLKLKHVKCLDGILYVPFSNLLFECGYSFACAAGNIIFTDETFEELTEKAKKFLLLHETGHIANKHTEKLAEVPHKEIYRERINYINNKQVMPIELEADSYALNFMTKEEVYSAMEEVQKVMDENFINDLGEMSLRKEFILK